MNSPARRPRVLQVITRLGLGGAEKVARSLVQGLRAEIDFGVFTVYRGCRDEVGAAMQRELSAASVPWFEGTHLPVKYGGMVTGALALSRAVRAYRPDVIHYHAEVGESCGAMLTRLRPAFVRTPALRTVHNSLFWRYWPRIGRWCDHRLAAARIACVSEAARAEFQRYRADSGTPPAQPPPALIYNGVSLPLRPPRPALRTPDVCRVLFAGRFEEQKGADLLCAALPRVRLPDGLRGELVALGHGAHEPLLRQIAGRPPPGWSVAVRPPIGHLPDVFPDFDLLIMPSRFEGLGLVAIEATLAGLPCLTTTAPGLDEALPGDHPWRAQPGEAADLAAVLTRALAERAAWPAATRRAQTFAQQRFAPAIMLAGYAAIYRDLADTQ